MFDVSLTKEVADSQVLNINPVSSFNTVAAADSTSTRPTVYLLPNFEGCTVAFGSCLLKESDEQRSGAERWCARTSITAAGGSAEHKRGVRAKSMLVEYG
ncbi:hypothetical protein R1sor_017817 [Riccia sorocarpa]|uniref:Uncharacterized protein n=1 Tax=Riccia sorocarpa TaxID=122646 RepID=A0ABD3I7W9_9MARC